VRSKRSILGNLRMHPRDLAKEGEGTWKKNAFIRYLRHTDREKSQGDRISSRVDTNVGKRDDKREREEGGAES